MNIPAGALACPGRNLKADVGPMPVPAGMATPPLPEG